MSVSESIEKGPPDFSVGVVPRRLQAIETSSEHLADRPAAAGLGFGGGGTGRGCSQRLRRDKTCSAKAAWASSRGKGTTSFGASPLIFRH